MSRLGRHSLVYGVGILFSKGVSFIMLPVYTRHLTPEDYGVMELIGMTLDVIAIVAGAKLALGIFRYYHKAESPQDRRAVVSTALIALGVSYAVVGLITFLLAGTLSGLVFGSLAHAPLIRIAACTLALQSLLVVPLAYARLQHHSVLFVFVNAVKLVIGLSLTVYLVVYQGAGVRGVFIASLVATATVSLGLLIYLVREVGFHFSSPATRNLLRYGIPLMGTQAATFVLTFGDRYFLQAAAETATVGIYALAYQFGFLLAAIGYLPFEAVWDPARFEIVKRPDRDAILTRGFVYLNLWLVTMAVALCLFVGDILRVMAAPAFHPAAALVPPILAAYVLQGWSQMQDTGILVRERTEMLALANWVAAGVAMTGYFLLVPRYLGLGAAIATLIAFAVRCLMIYAISQHLWPVRYDWRPVVRILLAAGGAVGLGTVLPTDPIGLSISLRVGAFTAYLIALWNLGILSPGDRATVRRVSRQLGVRLGFRAPAPRTPVAPEGEAAPVGVGAGGGTGPVL
jgi:O-antigen/teichoic acid export membrane protein